MSKQEQVNTENNLKRVSDTLLQLGLSPAALGINSQTDKTYNAQTGAVAALAAALNQSLGVTATASPAALLHSTPSWSQFTPPTPAQPLLATGHAPTPAVPGDLRSLFSSLGIAQPLPSGATATGAQQPHVHGAILAALGLPGPLKPPALPATDAGPTPIAGGTCAADPLAAHAPQRPEHRTVLGKAVPAPHVALTGASGPRLTLDGNVGTAMNHATARAKAAEAAIQRLEAGSATIDPAAPDASRTSL